MSTLADRINKALDFSGRKPVELARACGVEPPSVSAWRSGRTKSLKMETGVRAAEFLGVSAKWLMDGKGPMTANEATGVSEPRSAYLADRNALTVPVLDARGSMGLGLPRPEHETVVDNLRLTKDWVRNNLPTISRPDNLAVLSAHGDSMNPTFSDGDILLVDRGVDRISLDAVYVLALNEELYIKRIQRRITDGAVMILSDNPAYQPVIVANGERDSLQVLGRVVWAWNGRKL